MLLALCVRSPEARRRILAEVAGALKLGGDGKGGVKPGGKEGPARAFVDLVNSLLSHAGGGGRAGQAAPPRTGLAADLQKVGRTSTYGPPRHRHAN